MAIICLEILFWSGIGLLIYAYFGYPLLLFVLNKIIPSQKQIRADEIKDWPQVGFLIAAYNEEKVIGDKIENFLKLNYPKELIDIWIASDGSSDKTNSIVKSFMESNKNIHLLEFLRTGKSEVLNKAMNHIESEIVVFSDANTEYAPDAIKAIVKYFADPQVGCVSGRLVYRNPGEIISGKGESFYWRYETILKKMESEIGYVAGANGAIYAIRRELFSPLPPRTINDDFTTSMQIVEKGYKSIYEQNAIAYEDVAPTMKSEFKRHVRDGAGHYIAIIHLLGLLNPFLGLRSFIYWSHRIFRWIAPFLLMLLFIINIFIFEDSIYKYLFIIQSIFYLLAITGWIFIKNNKLPFLIYAPFYFCSLNLALFLGFLRVITKTQKTTWERTERTL